MSQFISSVRFRVKENCHNLFMSQIEKFPLPPGALQHTVVKTGDFSFCTFIVWQQESDLVKARPTLISFLDSCRDLLEELSPELGVTDPVSGPIVHQIK